MLHGPTRGFAPCVPAQVARAGLRRESQPPLAVTVPLRPRRARFPRHVQLRRSPTPASRVCRNSPLARDDSAEGAVAHGLSWGIHRAAVAHECARVAQAELRWGRHIGISYRSAACGGPRPRMRWRADPAMAGPRAAPVLWPGRRGRGAGALWSAWRVLRRMGGDAALDGPSAAPWRSHDRARGLPRSRPTPGAYTEHWWNGMAASVFPLAAEGVSHIRRYRNGPKTPLRMEHLRARSGVPVADLASPAGDAARTVMSPSGGWPPGRPRPASQGHTRRNARGLPFSRYRLSRFRPSGCIPRSCGAAVPGPAEAASRSSSASSRAAG